jgi:hypothetical protein
MLIIRICGVYLPSALSGTDDSSRLLNQTCCHRTYFCTKWIKIRQLERWQPVWVNICWYIFCYVQEKDVCFLLMFCPVFSEVQWIYFKGSWYCATYFSVHMEKCSKGDKVLKCMNLSSENSHEQSAKYKCWQISAGTNSCWHAKYSSQQILRNVAYVCACVSVCVCLKAPIFMLIVSVKYHLNILTSHASSTENADTEWEFRWKNCLRQETS